MNVFVDGLIFAIQRRGGVSRMWEECLERLPGLGVDIRLLVPWRADNDSLRRLLAEKNRFAGIQRDFLFWPRRIFERAGLRSRILERLYLGKGAQIFHSTYYSTVSSREVKKVVTVHDLILELFPGEFPERFAVPEREAKRKAIQNADAIVAVSQNSKADILTVFPFIPENRITVIHHGVSLASGGTPENYSDLAAQWRLPVGSGEYLLFVGNRRSYKNFDLLVQWLSRARGSGAFVVCVGGEAPAPERKQLERLRIANRCLFMEAVPDHALRVLYRNARALVFPSRYEGFGLPLLEAMASDCPVLCSDIAVFHEVAGDAAIYFDPLHPESLAAALDVLRRSDRQDLLWRGRQNCARFSWDITATKLANLYRDLA